MSSFWNTMSPANVHVTVTPNVALFDDVIRVVVTGLSPHHHATLVCRVSEKHNRFFSTAVYRSDERGSIDVSTMAALDGGSYDGVEPMGLIWALVQEPGQKPGRRLIKSDVTTPLVTHFYVLLGMLSPSDCLDNIAKKDWLAHTTCNRIYIAEGVQRIEVRHGRLKGTLFIPSGPGPFPGVMDLRGTAGGIMEDGAALLASHGIMSLALGYYMVGESKTIFTDLEYFEEALEYLLSQEKVIKNAAGVIGISFGGVVAIALAVISPKIKLCVEINSSCVMVSSKLTYGGKLLPYIEGNPEAVKHSDHGIIEKYMREDVSPSEKDYCSIPVEKSQCFYLIVHSEDDQNVHPVNGSYIASRLKRNNRTDYRTLFYPGAGHILRPPYSPHYYATYHSTYHTLVIWGGRRKAHAKASEDFWKKLLDTVKEKIREEVNDETKVNLQSNL